MTKSKFLAYLRQRVRQFERFYGISRGQAFMLWYAVEGLELDQDDAYEAVSYDGGNDKGIDFFRVDEEYERVVIAQGKYNSQGRYKPQTGELLELLHTTDWLSDPEALSREGREDLAAAAEDYIRALENGYSVEYIFVYCGSAKRELRDAAAKFTSSQMGETPARSARVVSLEHLIDLHEEYIDKSTRVAKEIVELDAAASFEQAGPYGSALVGSIPGTELQRLYEAHGMRLFDRNVRLFLGARKGGVNAGIRDTLVSPADRKNFWAYNNGMTLICDRYELRGDKGTVTLHNFSIVNGCQTTVSVANASVTAAREVSVLARIISVPAEALVDNIIVYTNSQNPIRPWDISSQDKRQKRLKRELAEEPHPFFYMLRRGETSQLSKDERSRLTRRGKLQVIAHDVLAQYLAAFSGLPVVAYKDKSRLFSTHKETVFPPDISAEKMILVWQAGQAAEVEVRSAIQEAVQRGDEAELKILRRGAKLFVLAVMGLILGERNGATYLNRLKREVAGSKKTLERLSKYAQVSLVWYTQAMKDLRAAGQDLNKVVRSQDTFPVIRDKVRASWKVQSMSKAWVKDALPKL